jgi:hypothetical protein
MITEPVFFRGDNIRKPGFFGGFCIFFQIKYLNISFFPAFHINQIQSFKPVEMLCSANRKEIFPDK